MQNAERLDKYANWLRQNKQNQATPEFKKVADAYKLLRAEQVGANKSASERDSVFGYSADRAQQMLGTGIEVIGRATGSEGIEQYGQNLADQQEIDIAQGGYVPKYSGHLSEQEGFGNKAGWLLEKMGENSISGTAGITTAVLGGLAAWFGAPAWVPAAIIGSGTAISGTMSTGEAAMEQKEKLGDFDTGSSLLTGTAMAILERIGAKGILTPDKLSKMSKAELVNFVREKGGRATAVEFAKELLKKGSKEGFTELGQDAAVMVGAKSQGADYTNDEVVNRLVDSFAVGTGIGSTVAGADLSARTVQAVPGLLTKEQDENVSGDKEQTESAKASFAKRIQTIATEGKPTDDGTVEFDLTDVDRMSTTGARHVIDVAHSRISEEIKYNAKILKDQLSGKDQEAFINSLADANDFIEVKDNDIVAASAELRSAKNKTKSAITTRGYNAVENLVGQYAEGQELLNLLRESQVLTEVHNDGYLGGWSKKLEFLNPIKSDSGYGDRGAMEGIGRMAITGGGFAVNPMITGAQLATVGAGRLADSIQGTRSSVQNFVNENLDGTPMTPPDVGVTPSILAQQEQERQDAERLELQRKEQQRAMNKQLFDAGAPPTLESPEDTMYLATGYNRDEVNTILGKILQDALSGNDPASQGFLNALQTYVESIQYGGKVDNLSPLIRKVMVTGEQLGMPHRQRNERVLTDLTRVESARAEGQLSEAQERGKKANQAFAKQLADGLFNDPKVDKLSKGLLGQELVNLQTEGLGKDPVADLTTRAQRLADKGIQPEVIDQYFMPYIQRVMQQQAVTKPLQDNVDQINEHRIGGLYYDVWDVPQQEITSADTSINISKLPAGTTELIKQGVFEEGMVVVDLGGGRHDNAVDALAEKGVELVVHDPFNRDAEHNQKAVSKVRDGRADIAMSHNVLNVIQEESNLLRVIEQAHNAIPVGNKAYFTVFQGDGKGVGKATSKGWQRNEKTQDYVSKIEAVFGKGNVVRKGKIITATKAHTFTPRQQQDIRIQGNQRRWNIDMRRDEAPVLSEETPFLNPFGLPEETLAATNLYDMPSEAEVQAMRDGTYKPEQVRSKVEAGRLLEQWFAERTGFDSPIVDETPEMVEYLSDIMATEAINNLERDSNAIGWYDTTLTAAKDVLRLVEPRIFESQESEQIFDYALAVTSNGTAVNMNFKYAVDVFRQYMDTGYMPEKFAQGGDRQEAMRQAFTFFNAMKDEGRDINEFMNMEFTVGELQKVLEVFQEQTGRDFIAPSADSVDTVVKGSYILGAKIGQGFYQNLRGDYSQLTMDMWWMRFWNRLTGQAVKSVNPATLAKNAKDITANWSNAGKDGNKIINSVLKDMGQTRNSVKKDPALMNQFALQADRAWERYFVNYKKENGKNPTKPSVFKKIGTRAKNLKGELQDTPTNSTQRKFMRNVAQRSIDKMSESGIDITMADFQALQWYPEKQLWRKLGVRPGNGQDNDYLDAAVMLAQQEGRNQNEIEEALPDSRRGRYATGNGTEEINESASPAYRESYGQEASAALTIPEEQASPQPANLDTYPDRDFALDIAQPGMFEPITSTAVLDRVQQIQEQTPDAEKAAAAIKGMLIGEPGSAFENGVVDTDILAKIAEALKINVIVVNSQAEMRRVAEQLNGGGNGDMSHTRGFMLGRSAIGDTYIVMRKPNMHQKNRTAIGKIDDKGFFTTFAHELIHGILRNLKGKPSTGQIRMANPMLQDNEYLHSDSIEAMINLEFARMSSENQEAVRNELDYIQERATVNTPYGRQPIRGSEVNSLPPSLRAKYDVYSITQGVMDTQEIQDGYRAQEGVLLDLMSPQLQRLNREKTKPYLKSGAEYTQDMVQYMMLDPQGAKQNAPIAYKTIKKVFDKLAKDEGGLIRFFSLAFAVLALPGMMPGDEEEPMMMAGALSPQGGGALTA